MWVIAEEEKNIWNIMCNLLAKKVHQSQTVEQLID